MEEKKKIYPIKPPKAAAGSGHHGAIFTPNEAGARARCRGWGCPGRKNRPHRFAGPALKTAAIPTLGFVLSYPRPEFLQRFSPGPKSPRRERSEGREEKRVLCIPLSPARGFGFGWGSFLLSLRRDSHGHAANAV